MPKKHYPELQMKFGENLQKLRIERKMSLREMAIKCDLDNSNMSKIENGKSNIQLSTLIELAKGLDIKPSQLLSYLDKSYHSTEKISRLRKG